MFQARPIPPPREKTLNFGAYVVVSSLKKDKKVGRTKECSLLREPYSGGLWWSDFFLAMVSHLSAVFWFPNSVKLICYCCGNGDSCNTESGKLSNCLRLQLYSLFPSSKVFIFSLGFHVKEEISNGTDTVLEGYLCLLLVLLLFRLMLIFL